MAQAPARGVAKIFALLGPTASGKTTMQQRLLRTFPQLAVPYGVWTRNYRPGEDPLSDSRKVSAEEFLAMEERGELTAIARIHGNLYGTPKANIIKLLSQGLSPLRVVSVPGTDVLLHDFPGQVTTIYLRIPMETIRERLAKRGDTDEDIEKRLVTSEYEISRSEEWDYVIDATRSIDEVFRDVADVIAQELSLPAGTSEDGGHDAMCLEIVRGMTASSMLGELLYRIEKAQAEGWDLEAVRAGWDEDVKSMAQDHLARSSHCYCALKRTPPLVNLSA